MGAGDSQKEQEVEYTPELLRKMQLVELEMLKELDRICRKHSIKYVLDAGTLLGAVRHGGFIPWDDDVDVRMLRADYDRFCEVCKTELNNAFFLQTYKTDPGFLWGYARILKNGTVFMRKDHEMIKSRNGIFIDVFPCDSYPDDEKDRRHAQRVSWLCRKGRYSVVGKKYAKKLSARIGFAFLNLFPVRIYHRMEEKLIAKCNETETQRVRCYGWGDAVEDRGFLRRWFFDLDDMKFEDSYFCVSKEWHDFLVLSFGEDYMIPVSEDHRKPRHTAISIQL